MYDIKFLQSIDGLKTEIIEGRIHEADDIERRMEAQRSKQPCVFNVETTNYCNMTCVMCPRTSLMTRKNIWIDDALFEKVVDQITPHAAVDLAQFQDFVAQRFGMTSDERSENAFYFQVVSRCLILHGYGEPLLDKRIVSRVEECSKRNIPTYFSCVPANLTVERAQAVMEAGLSVLKFSIDALDDETIQRIRGKRANFSQAFETIMQVIELKKRHGYKTLLVPTMIALANDDAAKQMYQDFLSLWADKDVFAYVKSQDNRWYFENDPTVENLSHYEQQYCEYPWTSLTVMADGSVVPCTQDYDTEMVFGNVNEQSLEEIWNGERYRDFRRWHITGQFPPGHKCAERCDQRKVCDRLKAGH